MTTVVDAAQVHHRSCLDKWPQRRLQTKFNFGSFGFDTKSVYAQFDETTRATFEAAFVERRPNTNELMKHPQYYLYEREHVSKLQFIILLHFVDNQLAVCITYSL